MAFLERGSRRLTTRLSFGVLWFGVLLFIAAAVVETSGQSATDSIHPILRLEKPKYLLGESIRFWVGVAAEGSGLVPRNLRKPCSLTITKPDGSTEIQTVMWSMDGNPDWGWKGGWGIKAKEAGLYELQLECSGKRTERIPLVVEANEIFRQIKATFDFANPGTTKIGTRVPVVFSVTNDSAFPIRFPQRGVMMEGIYIRVTRDLPQFRDDFFYPWEKLTQFSLSPDTYTWDVASKLPSVALDPGKRFEQRLTLADAYQFEEPGNYRVTFSTVVSVLVGDDQGPFANLCPIRLLAEHSEAFSVSK